MKFNFRPVRIFAVGLFALLALSWNVSAELNSGFSHEKWDQLLKNNVLELQNGAATQVNYEAMAKDRDNLKVYLNALAQVSKKEYETWHKDRRLAFLINAYNAWTWN